MDIKNTCCKALKKYGLKAQTMIFVEELGETLQALSKHERGGGSHELKDNLAQELADLYITAKQMEIGYGIEKEVQYWISAKLKMLEKRIED